MLSLKIARMAQLAAQLHHTEKDKCSSHFTSTLQSPVCGWGWDSIRLSQNLCLFWGQVHKSKRSRGTRVKHNHVIERNWLQSDASISYDVKNECCRIWLQSMMTLWVHSWPWYPAEGCFSVEEVAAGSTPVTVAIINYDNKGLLSTCHHMITITNNAVVAQLARAPSWSLGGRWFDASQRHWNPHIRDTEKPWFIARSIALMDAYMGTMRIN